MHVYVRARCLFCLFGERCGSSIVAAGTGYELVGQGMCIGADGAPTLHGYVAIREEVRARVAVRGVHSGRLPHRSTRGCALIQ